MKGAARSIFRIASERAKRAYLEARHSVRFARVGEIREAARRWGGEEVYFASALPGTASEWEASLAVAFEAGARYAEVLQKVKREEALERREGAATRKKERSDEH